MAGDWNFFDVAMLVTIVLSMAVGAWRGLVFEVMSLLGWFVAYFAAQWLTPMAAPHVPIGAPASPLNHAVTFALVFVAALVAWGLLSWLAKSLIHATPLSAIDRLLGSVFGAVRGLVLLLALAALISRTPWAEAAVWQESRGAALLRVLTAGFAPVLPASIGAYLRS
jgi:membrane protein required for colicin V production